MKSNTKLTKEQVVSLFEFLKSNKGDAKANNKLKLYIHPLKSAEVFAKYLEYSVESDGSIMSKIEIVSINPKGIVESYDDMFDDKKQLWAFMSDFIQVDFDANGNLIIL